MKGSLKSFFEEKTFKGAREEESVALNCLPESRQLSDIVSVEGYADTPEEASKLKKVAISDKLKKLQARCDNTRLVDAGGKEIRFYNLQYVCGGAAPPEEFVNQQREEIAALEKKYTLITMTCNPGGIPYP